MNTPDINFLRDVAALVDGIPEEHFNLSDFGVKRCELHNCHSVGCVAGWLRHHPDRNFNLGVPTSFSYSGTGFQWMTKAANRITGCETPREPPFQATWQVAYDLFELPELEERYGESSRISHKLIFGRRVIRYLRSINEPISDEYLVKYGH